MPPALSTLGVENNAPNAILTALSRQGSGRKMEYVSCDDRPKDGIHVCYVGHLDAEANAPQCELDGFKPSRVRRNGIHVSYDVSAERRNTCLLRWPLGRGGQRAATRA